MSSTESQLCILWSQCETFGINVHILKSRCSFWWPWYLRTSLGNLIWNWIEDLICRWHRASYSKNQTNSSWLFWSKSNPRVVISDWFSSIVTFIAGWVTGSGKRNAQGKRAACFYLPAHKVSQNLPNLKNPFKFCSLRRQQSLFIPKGKNIATSALSSKLFCAK